MRITTLCRASWRARATAVMLVAAFVLAALSFDGSARAQGGTVLAIDVGDVSGNSSTSVGTINDCFEVAPGATYPLDVVILNASDVVAAGLALNYDGVVTARSVADSLLNNESPDIGGSTIIDEGASDDLPNVSGSDHVIISNDDAIRSGGASGSGILIRFTMAAPTEPRSVTLGLAGFPNPAPVLNDSQAHELPLTTRDATLAVGTRCAPIGVTPTESPATSPQQSPTPGGSPGLTLSPGASPQVRPTPNGPNGEGTGGGGLPLAAWIGIGLGGGVVALGSALLALNPRLRRRLWPRP